jgi:hypothetical protein
MKVLFFLIASVLLGTVFSCTEEDSVKSIKVKYEEELSIYVLAEDGDSDSLLTIEQLRTAYKHDKIWDKYVDLTEDGMFILLMSEEEWLLTGVPKYDYDQTIQGLNSANRYISGIKDDAVRKLVIEAAHRGVASYRQSWRERYAKVKYLIDD